MSENKFIGGLFFKDPHENAPDFVMAKGSIKVADMRAWLDQQDGEWVNFDLKRSREGKPYAQIDDWKPDGNRGNGTPRRNGPPVTQRPQRATDEPRGEFEDDDIPFLDMRGRW